MTTARNLTIAAAAVGLVLVAAPTANAAGDTSFNTRQHQIRYTDAAGGAYCIKERRGRDILPLTRFHGPWSKWHAVAYFAEPCWVLDPSEFTFP